MTTRQRELEGSDPDVIFGPRSPHRWVVLVVSGNPFPDTFAAHEQPNSEWEQVSGKGFPETTRDSTCVPFAFSKFRAFAINSLPLPYVNGHT